MRQKRESSVTKKCRLLCPQDGCGLQRVVKVGDPITLACGHERGELLPTDKISIEHLGTKLGRELFSIAPSLDLAVDEHPLELLDLPDSSEEAVASCLEALAEVHNEIEY
jgi:hypothetical protein